nr:PREDICTED: uncharacterized protein LOC109040226 [Bemisia tabaci]
MSEHASYWQKFNVAPDACTSHQELHTLDFSSFFPLETDIPVCLYAVLSAVLLEAKELCYLFLFSMISPSMSLKLLSQSREEYSVTICCLPLKIQHLKEANISSHHS